MLKFRLPVAPGLNNATRNVRGVGRVKTARYKRWLKDADTHYMLQGLNRVPKITVPYICRMVFPKIRGDIDGRGKLLLDFMVSRELTIDDKHCWGLFLEKTDRDGNLVHIEVEPHAGSQLSSKPRAA